MKLNYKRTILIGLAFMSISAFWQMYDSIIPLILKNSFGIGETLTGTIMAADNVLALFLLPIFGTLSDKVDTPIGKRMPFILGGTALACVLLFLLPTADNSRKQNDGASVPCGSSFLTDTGLQKKEEENHLKVSLLFQFISTLSR